MNDLPEVQETASEKMNVITKIVGVFSNPKPVFENIRIHPDWLVPVLIAIVLTMVFSWITQDLMLEFQKEVLYENTMIPEEFKDVAIEELENKSAMRQNIETIGGSIVNIFLVYLIGSGAFYSLVISFWAARQNLSRFFL